jgi:peptidoglycan/LPS O-acetylase OafA/YrhL
MNASRIEFAHALRGLAAIIVLINHFLGVFWFNPNAVSNLLKVPAYSHPIPTFITPLYFFGTFFDYGSLGVALFFLISGFVIPFSLTTLSRKGFFLARFFRIYPIYWITLTISIGSITLLQNTFSNEVTIYAVKHIISQAFLLRGWFWLPSIDGVSWTLEIEIVFYVIAACLAPKLTTNSGGKLLICYILLALFTCIAGPALLNMLFTGQVQNAFRYLIFALPFTIFMFIGTVFYLHMQGNLTSASLLQGVISAFFCFCVSIFANESLKNLTLNSYALALIFFTGFYWTRGSFRSNWLLDWLADISYPLYAVHALFGYSLMYYLLSLGWQPLSIVVITFITVLLISWTIHILLEKRLTLYGKMLAKKIINKESAV